MQLPIDKYRELIEVTVLENPATIIVGETGSGKTTQVPGYLYETGFAEDGCIGVTEPRRIAAISAAEFVASQVGCDVGEEVGFQIRSNNSTSEKTKIKFMTDGILLQEIKSDPLFSRYSVLIFDEAHERGLNTDFLLGLVKRALAKRDDLKVVVMSATLEAEKFAEFFGGAPILKVEGRMYPVEVRYLTEHDIQEAIALLNPQQGQEIEALAAFAVEKIRRSGDLGDILIFMPGEAEIHRVIRNIESLEITGVEVFPVHGSMSPDDQRKIFESVRGRKVAVATNIAETGITVEGVVHVIDSGLIKESNFDPRTGIGTLKVVEHSKAGLEQRRGRAGRTQPGICWRLFSDYEYDKVRYQFQRSYDEEDRLEYTKPEIQRSDLAGVVLRLIDIGIKDVEGFDYVDTPSLEMMHGAVDTLHAIGAITDEREMTEVGKKILDIPLDPRHGRMILEAEKFGCVEEVVAIAAGLSLRRFFLRPKDKEDEADSAKRRFVDGRSDLLTAIAVMDEYKRSGRDRRWASDNFINWKAVEEALSVRKQIEEILESLGIKFSRVGYHLPKNQFALTSEEKAQGEAIGKAVLAGFMENLAMLAGRHAYNKLSEQSGRQLFIHPASVLFGNGPQLLLPTEIVETTKVFACNCQAVELDWLLEVAPHAVTIERSEPTKDFFSDEYHSYEETKFNGNTIQSKRISVPPPIKTISVPPPIKRIPVPPPKVEQRPISWVRSDDDEPSEPTVMGEALRKAFENKDAKS